MSDIKKKSLYTAYSRILTIVINIISQFVLTPIVLSFFGPTLYGIYTLINKTNNYLSIVDIRPTAILRLKLAHDKQSGNIQEKCMFIGASYTISMIFTPVFILCGCVFAYFFPSWFHISNEYVNVSRWAIVLLSVFLAINGFLGIPEAILRGNNIEYKGYFVEPIRLLLVAGLTILFLYYGWGLLGVILAMFLAALFAYVSRFCLRRRYLSEYVYKKPQYYHIKEFFTKGGWYLCSSFMMQTINNFDVLIIGIMLDPKAVAVFAITKAIIFRVVESIETIVTSITSSIGEIVGIDDKRHIIDVRRKIIFMVMPVAFFVTSYFVVFNGIFISLWTGSDVYAGTLVNLLICLSALFLMLTSTEEIFILSYLDFKTKAMCLSVSAILAIIVSILLSKSYGLAGNAAGILSGRVSLFLLYHVQNNRVMNTRIKIPTVYCIKCLFFLFIIYAYRTLYIQYVNASIFSFLLNSCIFAFVIGVYIYRYMLESWFRDYLKTMLFNNIKKRK